MPETSTITAYKFNELSERAKDKVREWYAQTLDYEWYDSVYEGAKMDGEERGFFIEDIRFSGFWSQGDGASWTGDVVLPKFLEWMLEQPEDTPQYRRIGDDRHRWLCFVELMKDGWIEKRTAVNRHGYHYVHENTVSPGGIAWEDLEGLIENDQDTTLTTEGVLKGASVVGVAQGIDVRTLVPEIDDAIKEEVRDYCQEIYRRLEKEYDWLNEDAQIEDACEANEWLFDEEGEMV